MSFSLIYTKQKKAGLWRLRVRFISSRLHEARKKTRKRKLRLAVKRAALDVKCIYNAGRGVLRVRQSGASENSLWNRSKTIITPRWRYVVVTITTGFNMVSIEMRGRL